MRSGRWVMVGGLAVVCAVGVLFSTVRSSKPSPTAVPAAAAAIEPGAMHPAAAPSTEAPPSLASTPIPTDKPDGAAAPTAPKLAAPGTPIEIDPRAPGFDPIAYAATREQDAFAFIQSQPRDDAFAGPRETALLGIVQSRLDARDLTGVAVERAECFASACVMELVMPGADQVAQAIDALQSGPLGDSVSVEGTPSAAPTRIRVGVFYRPENRDHEAFLSQIGPASVP